MGRGELCCPVDILFELSSSLDYTCVRSSHVAIQTKGEDFRNAPKSILDLHDKSVTCNKFQAFTTFSAISRCVRKVMLSSCFDVCD